MAETDHPIALSLEECKAFHEKAWSHAVGIVSLGAVINRHERARSDVIGTGTACSWRGKRLILTARHVVDGAGTGDIAFLPRAGTSLGWDTPGEIQAVTERVVIDIEKIIRCEWEDLAAILPRPEGVEPLNVEFCDLPKRLALDQTVKGDGSVLLIGYPVDQIFEVSESRQHGYTTKLMACPCDSFWGELDQSVGSSLDSSYDPERHILVRFQPSKKDSKPHGYSGAGVWCDPAKRGPVWTADPLLLGVETCAHRKAGLVRAVRARALRQFLDESI